MMSMIVYKFKVSTSRRSGDREAKDVELVDIITNYLSGFNTITFHTMRLVQPEPGFCQIKLDLRSMIAALYP